MRRGKIVVLFNLFFVLSIITAQTSNFESSIPIVLDLERQSSTDILLLRNGDKLTGTILNENFSIRTSYAQIKLNNKIIAGIDLEGGANNIESVITVNNNKFSGFIDDPIFVFKLQSGPQIQIRREKVLKAVFRIRDSERRGIPQRQFVILKNGDYFSGKIVNSSFVVSTTYAKVPVEVKEVESITMIGQNNPLTKILQINGDTLQGVLETEDFIIDLDIGFEAKIYQDRIEIIYCVEGYIPEMIVTKNNFIKISDINDNYVFEFSKDETAIIIKDVPKESAYYGFLMPNDQIISVDGNKYQAGMLTPKREKLLNGEIKQIIIGVKRGNSIIYFTIIKK